jgi:oligopeptide/dipeptide ABC transporter ATP-binding protein
VLDEPVSALDVSIRAQILNLLKELQSSYELSYLLIAHNLATVRYMSHTVGVMYLGKIVEEAPPIELFTDPQHPYTKALISASLPAHPRQQREEIVLTGEVPSPLNPPGGCAFHPRCPFVMERCATDIPVMREYQPGHATACHLYE